MKKGKIAGLLAILGMAAVLACGCGEAARLSPYEVAKSLGDTNESAASWLTKEVGGKTELRKAYEEAVADGYEGTYIQFLKEIGYGDGTAAINRSLMSSVDVFAEFESRSSGSGFFFDSTQQQFVSGGSGIVYSVDAEKGDAYFVTNYHVIYNTAGTGRETIPYISDDIYVMVYGRESTEYAIPVSYVGGSMQNDVAVLKAEGNEIIKSAGLIPIEAADSDAVLFGEPVYAVGNSNLKGLSVVSGIISVDAEYISIEASDGKTMLSLLEMRTDAPINHGNSGGGLFDADGRLVGLVNARSEAEGVENFGYAIPANLALSVAQNIIDNEKSGARGPLRATLGITVTSAASEGVFDERIGKAYRMETVTVTDVDSNGAAAGKIRKGDSIYSIRINDGKEIAVTRRHVLTNLLYNVRKGDTLTIVLSRGNKTAEAVIVFDDADFTLIA